MAAVNAQIDEQYDKEYALIQLIEDSSERRAAQEVLDARYLEQRRVAAMEYAETLAAIVMPVWNSEDIQQAGADVDALMLKLREYTTASLHGSSVYDELLWLVLMVNDVLWRYHHCNRLGACRK